MQKKRVKNSYICNKYGGKKINFERKNAADLSCLMRKREFIYLCVSYCQKSTKTLYVCEINNIGEREREKERGQEIKPILDYRIDYNFFCMHTASLAKWFYHRSWHGYFNLAEDYKHVLNFSFHFFWFHWISFQIFFLYLLPGSHVLTV